MITNSVTPLLKSLSNPAETYPFSTSEVTIGRDTSCDIVLDSAQAEKVSRRHCSIKAISDNAYQLCDLNSSNGSFLNGQRIQGCVPLKSGDRIRLSANGPEFQFQGTAAAETVIDQTPATQAALSQTPPTQIGFTPQSVQPAPTTESPFNWRKIRWVAGVIAIALVLGLSKSYARRSVSSNRPADPAPITQPAPAATESPAPSPTAGETRITNLRVCDAAEGGTCTRSTQRFDAQTTRAIVLAADIAGVPDGSMINLGLLYTADGKELERVKLPLEHRAGGNIAKLDFKLSRPAKGWPPGAYKFVFLVDGKQDASSEAFVVQ